jgi:RNA polymerase sigma-70 factor, ECF subfamily
MIDLAVEEPSTQTSSRSNELEQLLVRHRPELTAFCYRMLGSASEAEDAVQETALRAWRALDSFEGRAQLKSWLYRIATNVCLDMAAGSQRRARPMDLGPAGSAEGPLGEALSEPTWLEPMPDVSLLPEAGDPAERALAKESVRLAFVAALQQLPARQRAVLILREVLRWRAVETAALLDTSVASVNSALQRARATLAESQPEQSETLEPLGSDQARLLERYVDAFERYDMDALTALLSQEARLSMPPYALWLRGPEEICTWMLGIGHGCRGSRLVATAANGSPAYGQYRPAPSGGFEPWALQVIELQEGRITGINSFLDTAKLFPLFGLPPQLEGKPAHR